MQKATRRKPDGQVQGYDAFQADPYKWDICVLDVMMPKKDGFELAKNILEMNEDVPIIFLTAKTMQEDVEEGFSLGADDYPKKPFNTAELTMRIDAVLRRVQAKRLTKYPSTISETTSSTLKVPATLIQRR